MDWVLPITVGIIFVIKEVPLIRKNVESTRLSQQFEVRGDQNYEKTPQTKYTSHTQKIVYW